MFSSLPVLEFYVPLDECITDPFTGAQEGVRRGNRYTIKCQSFHLVQVSPAVIEVTKTIFDSVILSFFPILVIL